MKENVNEISYSNIILQGSFNINKTDYGQTEILEIIEICLHLNALMHLRINVQMHQMGKFCI